MVRSPDKLQALRLLVDRGLPIRTVLDVGVLTGTPELIEAFPDTPHVLFEPIVEFNPAIGQAYSQVRHQLVNAAVSNVSGQGSIASHSMFEGMPITHSWLVDQPGQSGLAERSVPVVSLDDWIAANPVSGPYFLKIDIDGLEIRVLEGARATLRDTAVVMIETPVLDFSDRIRFLEAEGFVLFDLVEPVYYDDALWQCDAIFLSRQVRRQHFADLRDGFDAHRWRVFKLTS